MEDQLLSSVLLHALVHPPELLVTVTEYVPAAVRPLILAVVAPVDPSVCATTSSSKACQMCQQQISLVTRENIAKPVYYLQSAFGCIQKYILLDSKISNIIWTGSSLSCRSLDLLLVKPEPGGPLQVICKIARTSRSCKAGGRTRANLWHYLLYYN
jgi:hypothetical protein